VTFCIILYLVFYIRLFYHCVLLPLVSNHRLNILFKLNYGLLLLQSESGRPEPARRRVMSSVRCVKFL